MALSAADLQVGDTFTQVLVEDLKRTQLVQYSGASGDYNPLHSDEIYTTNVAGYPSVFAHGMLTMGMTARLLTDTVGDGRLLSYGGRFTAQVWPGDTLTATATVTAIDTDQATDQARPVAHFEVATVNQDGATVFAGTASAAIDR